VSNPQPGLTAKLLVALASTVTALGAFRAQPGAPGPCIYSPVTGCPLIPPGTRFHFHVLLRLAGLRWSYSNLPPHGNYEAPHCLILAIVTLGSLTAYSKVWISIDFGKGVIGY
jgi:hypothetical protein